MVMFSLLGPLEIHENGKQPTPLQTVEGSVLAVLAHSEGGNVPRDTLLDEIWGPDGTIGALQASVYRINQKTTVKIVDGRHHQGMYRLLAETDLGKAKAALKEAHQLVRQRPEEAHEVIAAALKLWRGEPLHGLESRSGGDRIDQLRKSIVRLHEQLRVLKVEVLWKLGHWPELLADIEAFLEDHPFNEDLHRYRFLATQVRTGNSEAYKVLRESKKLLTTRDGHYPDFIEDLRKRLSDPQPVEPEVGPAEVPVRCLHNLPPATYSEFVPVNELPRLKNAMDQELPVVAVTAIGGRGKRTLVHHFCLQLVQGRDFDGVVWVSGRQPGAISLSTVLDQLAVTMHHTSLDASSDKEQQVRNLLQHQRVLIVIEGYENTKDQELDRWLTELPPRSKALLTTIEYPQTLRQFCYEVGLMTPPPEMLLPFFTQLLKRRPIDGLEPTSPVLKQLWDEWSGNYKLLEWMVGQLPDRGLAEVRASVSGMSSVDVVLTSILRGSWTGLTDAAKSVLLALTCYPNGVERHELENVSGSSADFSDLVRGLQHRFFVKASGIERPMLFIDPLVGRKIQEPEGWPGGEDEAIYERWIAESIGRASRVGFCPEDVGRLEEFDVPGVRQNLEYAITWAMDHGQWQSVIELGREMRYYYYVRGLWSPETDVNFLRADAAHKLGDFQEEFDALTYKLNILAKQGNRGEAARLIDRVQPLAEKHKRDLTPKSVAAYRHARALHLVNLGDLPAAAKLWSVNITQPEVLGEADYSANLRWYGDCLIKMGGGKRAEGRSLLLQATQHAADHGFERAQVLIELWLAQLDLENSPDELRVRETLANLERLNERLRSMKDLRYTADHHHLLARCWTLLNCDRAAEHQRSALELDARLGIQRPAPTHGTEAK